MDIIGYIMVNELKVRIPKKMLDVVTVASTKIIHANHLIPLLEVSFT